MRITDLDYFEQMRDTQPISGSGSLASVFTYAIAVGDSTYTLTKTGTSTQEIGQDGAISFGQGLSLASGDYTFTEADFYGEGDTVIGKTKTHYFVNRDLEVSRVFVMAIDHP